MKYVPALLVVAATAAPAVAEERAMFVSVAGTIGIGTPGSDDDDDFTGAEPDPEGTLMARLIASWEEPPLPYKEPRGYHWRGSVVPEIMVGVIRVADHRNGDADDNTDAYVALGARLEAGFSQHKMGLFQVTARGGVYVAARAGLLTDPDRTPLLEGAIGEHIYLGDTVRFGAEVGFMGIFGQPRDENLPVRGGVVARAPWRDGTGDYLSIHATVYLGFAL